MLANRSMPGSTVIPVLNYPDVGLAADWLASAFCFTLRWQAGSHRAQMNVGDGCIAVAQGAALSQAGISIMVRVEDVDAHHARARAAGHTYSSRRRIFRMANANTASSTWQVITGRFRNPSLISIRKVGEL